MNEWLHDLFRDRPWWMNAVMVFCAWMAFVYMPWDIFWKPVSQDQEVWFGIIFTGWSAKLLAVPHWIVYSAAVYGFRRRRGWMGVAAPIYTAQVAFGMFLWPILQYGSLLGLVLGVIAAVPFAGLTVAFWNARDHFAHERQAHRDKYGDWAVVTGASSGIGLAFARALAGEGMSIVLTARREEKLREVADELEKQNGIATRVVVADLSTQAGVDAVAAAVEDLEIAILVNNAGFGYAGRFDKLEAERLREMVMLNCMAPMLLTHKLLPGMQARRRGAVIIVGSVSGRQPLPLHNVYSATKAFDLHLGEALFVEMRSEGVDVLVLEPGSTETEFQQAAGEITHAGESPDKVVAVALDALGQQPSVISGWLNWLRANVASRLVPGPMVVHVAKHVMEVQTPSEMR
ncbi:MAG: SDR family NAD(P)-dependent oxidoreductase [Deltaproteobacteria bacterium]|nr:SDR family NAD(P)-dependent oxidoreductase [Deltaproteobacteria bacterium]MBW2385233.1 SDR family NAD(P)-dependent oxidoreductase [Deltaproteobacteria bacterium]MBW2695405.1 SDR family NAD(P)-dependent oxidoreductase [Deltaproteobacteria bacterium]